MASITSPLRSLARNRPQSILQAACGSASSSLAGSSRSSFVSARANFSSTSHIATTSRSRGVARPTAIRRWNSSIASQVQGEEKVHKALIEHSEEESSDNLRIEAPAPGSKTQQLGQIKPRLSLTFTCTADECNHRSTHEFSKQAYTKGIVLVQCPSCKNRHLIADHLGWFKESTEEGTLKTIEDLLKAKGEKVRTGRVNWDGDIEYDGENKA